jgi:integrase
MSEVRVWIRKRTCRKGKDSYHARWIDPDGGGWKSKYLDTDLKRATLAAAKLQDELEAGTFKDVRTITWADFLEEHLRLIPGQRHREEAQRILTAFGEERPVKLKDITFGLVERYEESLRADGLSEATVAKCLRYLRAALHKAVRRGYLAKNPMEGWRMPTIERKAMRILTPKDEAALLKAAKKIAGDRMRDFVDVAMNTGGRKGELLGLTWDHVDFEKARVHFTHTKTKQDRYVPINPELVATLRKLKAKTQQLGGPFMGMLGVLHHKWLPIVKAAKIRPATIHDMRRTWITRLVRANVPLTTVKRLAGHSNITTTERFYIEVSDQDLRQAVKKLRKAKRGGGGKRKAAAG